MKLSVLVRLALLTMLVITAISCKEKKSALPNPSGSSNEILIIMDKNEWESPVGDTVKAWFTQQQLGLPQPEPIFDVLNLPAANFERNVKAYRNIVYVKISPSVDSARISFKESPWAKTQKYFQLEAPDAAAFLKLFEANKDMLMQVFLKAEQDRLIAIYKKNPDNKIAQLFKNKFHMDVNCSPEYNINKDSGDFVWISRETNTDSRGIVFFQKEYTSVNQLQYQAIIDVVDAELKAYIPGPLKGSYMALDTVAPIIADNYNYAETHYAVLMKGLWMVENDFMGGPFVLNVVLDQKNNRVIYMFGYVYAPEDKKRNAIRHVEAIMFSTDIDYNEPETKTATE